jgi:nicotinate-nucleotide pyrophosphorylase (carboxylating)
VPAAPVDWLSLYLQEDLGAGDVTSDSVFPPSHRGTARIVARERALVAGSHHAVEVFRRLGAKARVLVPDGQWTEPGQAVLRVEGPTRAILAGERLALNLLARMSGIASQTRLLMEVLAKECSAAMVAGTRKTTPGFRAFEKEAIRIGGGDPHRFGLHDAILLKDNHIAACGSVAEAVRRARAAHPGMSVECEVESLDDALVAAGAGASWLLIDNQSPETGKAWAERIWKEFPGVRIEASGGITADRVAAYGWADRISLGALTQNVRSRDFGLDWDAAPTGGKEQA